ncbi:protein kinase, partial [bacterium]|nr:protein kinase [bacterium]
MADSKTTCPACGSPMSPDEQICPHCGRDTADLTTKMSTSPPKPQRPTEDHTVVGDFRIVREIGRGGMGTVYEAHQESMHRSVALKILDAGAVPSRKTEARFEREAWIGGRLSHPNVVKVYAQGVEGRSHYIAMELAGGESLHSEIREARTRRAKTASDSSWCAGHIRRMVSLFADVADAFYYVHQQGVVHRDIKPSNLVLSEDGSRLMITDFGLARDEESASLTRPGDFMGTVRYMSPEQLLAQRIKVDHRSDIWSLGVSLYEAVTLDLPYSGDSEEAFIGAISAKDPIPARARDSAVPRDLETILMKCLERDPERRYASAAELAQDLRHFLAGEPVLARRPGPLLKAARFAKRRRALVAVIVVAVAVLSVFGVRSSRQSRLREGYTATLARLEDGGRISVYDARLAIGRQLEPDEQELRAAFLSGSLPADLRLRFARYLLRPDMLVDPYVDRTQFEDLWDSVYAEVIEWHWDWGLVAVIQATAVLDGDTIQKPAYAPWGLLILLEGEEIRSLCVGQHTLGVELRTWFFDLDDVMSPDDE